MPGIVLVRAAAAGGVAFFVLAVINGSWLSVAGGVLAAASTVTGALIEGITANRIDDLGAAGARVCWTAYLLSFGATLWRHSALALPERSVPR